MTTDREPRWNDAQRAQAVKLMGAELRALGEEAFYSRFEEVKARVHAQVNAGAFDASPELADAAGRHQESETAYHSEPVGPFPAEPAFGSPEAVQRAAEWICKLDPKGIELPAIVESNGHGGAFYVGQFNRDGDAQLASAAREMAEALEERLGGQEKAERLARLIDEGEYFPERTLHAVAALRKAGRLGGGR